jgi:hypothetical protein
LVGYGVVDAAIVVVWVVVAMVILCWVGWCRCCVC